MMKRVFLFLVMNLAIIVIATIAIALIEFIFGVNISAYAGGYSSLLLFAIIFGFSGSFLSLILSKWMAKKAYGVQVVSKTEISNLGEKERLVYTIVEELSERNHITMPEVGFYENSDPNAFATGASKNNSLVAVSTGLLHGMDKAAIEGVIGHEMAHILNGDMVTMTLLQGVLNTFVIFFARTLANIVSQFVDEKLSYFAYIMITIFFEVILGILASMIAMKFSRYREFRADEGSARFLGKEKMIAGLEALKSMQKLAAGEDSKFAAMKISTKKRSGIMKLFSSHPDLDERIKRLEDLRI